MSGTWYQYETFQYLVRLTFHNATSKELISIEIKAKEFM